MIWKKNIFSYFMWVLYTVLALGALYLGVAHLCSGMNYPVLGSMIVCCAVLLLGSLAAWGTFLFGRKEYKLPSLKGWQKRILESVILAVLLIMGLALRLRGIAGGVSANHYFDVALVGPDKTIPNVPNGMVQAYLYLLHFVFLVFGNKLAAGIWLQMILQYAGILCFYAAVRKLSGSVPAVTLLLFSMTSPYMVGRAITLSPGALLLFFCGIALCLAAMTICVKEKWTRIILSPIAGLTAGVLMCRSALLSLLIVGLWMRKREDGEKIIYRVIASVLGLVAALIGWFWGSSDAPDVLLLPFSGDVGYHPWDAVPLILCSLGIFSFWCDKKTEKLSVWTPFALFLTALSLFQMLPESEDLTMWILLSVGILTGVGISQLGGGFVRIAAAESAESDSPKQVPEDGAVIAQEAERKQPVLEEENKSDKPVGEPGKVVTVTVRGETKQVKLLDNPLPLPKRREHKPMDYGKKTEVAYDGYDYPVADDDDYDI